MLEQLNYAEDRFQAAVGGFSSAFNATMFTKSFDQSTVTAMLTAMQNQAQGLVHIGRAIAEVDQKLDIIKRKLGV